MPIELIERRVIEGLGTLHLARDASGRELEFVDALDPGIPKDRKWVITVSTQFGCAIGCVFCDAGSLGFRGSVPAEAVLDQIRIAARDNPDLDPSRHPRIKIHFARMGEPSLNPDIPEALEGLAAFGWPGLMPSISSVAPDTAIAERFFERLIELKPRFAAFQLQFSLHATDEAERRRIVPVRTWPLERIARYGERFVRDGDRKVTLNFALDGRAAPDPGPLIERFDPRRFLVKITPVNPSRRSAQKGFTDAWEAPTAPIAAFAQALNAGGIETVLSAPTAQERSSDSSCGQLWSDPLRRRGETLDRSRGKRARSYVDGPGLPAAAARWDRELEPFRRAPADAAPPEALAVLDMQELFLDPASPAFVPEARVIASNVMRLAEAFRTAGRPVFFFVYADGGEGPMRRWWKTLCAPGSPGTRLFRPLESYATDGAESKSQYSAFRGTGLERRLREAGARSIALAGVLTNLCVDATARDAFMRGFEPTVALDATAAHLEELHLSSLRSLAWGIAEVRPTDEVLGRPLRRKKAAQPSPTEERMPPFVKYSSNRTLKETRE